MAAGAIFFLGYICFGSDFYNLVDELILREIAARVLRVTSRPRAFVAKTGSTLPRSKH